MERFEKLLKLFEFQEECAYKIRMDDTHEDHDDRYNERYWHGFEVAMRYCKNRLRDYIAYPEIIVVDELS